MLSVGLVITLASLLALVLVAQHKPDLTIPPDKPLQGFHFGETTFTVLINALAVTLSVGFISLVVEFFLRVSYAETLRKYVNLNEAAVRGRLQGLSQEPYPLATAIGRASAITIVARDAQAWVATDLAAVIDTAKARGVVAKLIFPDPDSQHFPAMAASLGLTADDLVRNIESAVKAIETRWTQARGLHGRSAISIVTADLISYDVCVIDDQSYMFVGAALGHRLGDRRLAIHVEAGAYPGDWIGEQAATDHHSGEMWAANGGSPTPSAGVTP